MCIHQTECTMYIPHHVLCMVHLLDYIICISLTDYIVCISLTDYIV